MKRKNSARSALITSIISLLLCVTMLAGTTFAWFTDSVQSDMNIIAAGNLDIELEYYYDDTDDGVANGSWRSVSGRSDLFTGSLWEPGHAEVVYLRLRNLGSLALQYNFTINVTETTGINVYDEELRLSEYIYMGVVDDAEPVYTTRAAAIDAARNGTHGLIGAGYFDPGFMLAGQADQYLALVVYMPESIDNHANYKTGTTPPEIQLGLKLYATQYMHERDSFDETYDDITTIADFSQYQQYMRIDDNDGTYLVVDDFTADTVIHWGPSDVTMDLGGKTITAGNKSQFIFGAQNGGILHLTGDGTVNAGKGFLTSKLNATLIVDAGTYNFTDAYQVLNDIKLHCAAQNSSKIVINGGTFTTNVDDAVLFFATTDSTIEINGGFFENTADPTPDLLEVRNTSGSVNRIILRGGTFVNYNPLEDRMCYTGAWPGSYSQFGGSWMLLWEGYTVVSETQPNGDIWYSVVPE